MKLFGFKQNTIKNLHEEYARGQSMWKLPSITVFEATQKASGRSVLLWLYDEKVKAGSEENQLFSARIRAVISLKIPMVNIISYGIDDKGTAFIITEQSENICLSRLTIPAEKIAPAFYAIVKMVNQLHTKGLYLGTISPELFSVDSGGKIYLQAPTFLFHSLAGVQHNEHTESFIAPELKFGKELAPPADCYSLGALLYFMMNRNYLRMANNAKQHNEYVRKYLPSFLVSRFKSISWLVDLLLDCLTWEPEKRPAAAEDIFDRMKSHMPVAQKTIQSLVPLFEWKKLGTVMMELFATRLVAGTLVCFGLLFFISAGDMFGKSSASDPLAKTFSSAVTKNENSVPSEAFSLLKKRDLKFGEPKNGFAAVHDLEAKRGGTEESDPHNEALRHSVTLEPGATLEDTETEEMTEKVAAAGVPISEVPVAASVTRNVEDELSSEKEESKDPGPFVSKVPYIEEQFTAVETLISHLARHRFPEVPDLSWCKILELEPNYTSVSEKEKE